MAHGQRFEDTKVPGGIDPKIALGKLIAQVENLAKIAEGTATTVGKISDDVMEIKLQRAAEAGQKQGLSLGANVLVIGLTLVASIASAWATVKATVTSIQTH